MTDQRGLSLVELLVAAVLTTIVAGGLFSAYVATTRSFGESSAQVALQRQGTQVLEEIGRQVRGATSVDLCNGIADRLRVKTAAGDDLCFYARADGALCEARGSSTCRNLLAGGLKPIVLLRQPSVLDQRCVRIDGVPIPAGDLCFSVGTVSNSADPPTQVNLAFAIRDSDGDLDRDLDGVNAMAFRISLTCSGRNC